MAVDVTYGGAGMAGLVSFLSPCVLPLVPPYLCYMAGVSLDQLTGQAEEEIARHRIMLSALVFVLGFSTVFITLGASASAIGRFFREPINLGLFFSYGGHVVVDFRQVYAMSILPLLAGIVIIVMGLHFLGVFRIALLHREARFHVRDAPAGPIGSYLMGLAFAFGWTPCIGPVLGAILALAGAEQTVTRGAGLLAAYSLGLGVPFLVAGLFAGPFMHFLRRFRGHLGTVEKVMGGLLVVTGILFLTGQISVISWWLLSTFPGLANIG
jgi:cytochrome c-type biogenesis protein